MIVADTSALFAVLNDEPDARTLLDVAAAASIVWVSTPTWVELSIVVSQRLGASGRDRLLTLVASLNVRWVPFDAEYAYLAFEAHRRYGRGSGSAARLNFGDCFAYALARSLEAPLLFKGDDFVHTDIVPALAP